MKSYKHARRSFLAGTGAAIGLHTMLRGMEAQAQAPAAAPKRLLVTHHPVGTLRYAWVPTGSGSTYTQSRILKPFEDAGLRGDMMVLDGLNMDVIGGPGGGHEKGTVVMLTGTPTKGTRSGQTETDDAASAGPSVDQLLLALRPNDLAKQTFTSLYALCDDRVDFREISTRCMRYTMDKRALAPAINNFAGETPYENTPLSAELKPLNLYTTVFGSIMTGGASDPNAAALARARAGKKSVLDFSLGELTRLRTLAPASSKPLLDAHESAIREVEKQFDATMIDTGKCTVPAKPADVQAASYGNTDHNNYGNEKAPASDDTLHQQIGELHQAVILAAFQCDLTRVALFQWSPGTNHVAFGGQYPGQPSAILMHHPVSHRIGSKSQEVQSNPDAEFLVNIEIWYNTRTAAFLNKLKATKDPFDPAGGSLLDNMIVPYLTEVAETTHTHNPMSITMFGGKNLGFHGGQFLSFNNRPYNDLWLTILQGFGVTLADLKAIQVNGATGATLLKAPYTKALEGVQG